MGRTPAPALDLLVSVVEDGRSYAQVACDLGLARSTVERRIKGLLRRMHSAGALALRVQGLDSLVAIRRERQTIMAAARAWDECPPVPARQVLLDADEVAAGASRLRARGPNARRDIALIYTLLCTGLKTLELPRLQVGDSLDEGGAVRKTSNLRPEAAANGVERPLFFNSTRAVASIDAYLDERIRRRLGTGEPSRYRGLDPVSRLFLTESGEAFRVDRRSTNDARPTCKPLQATLRQAFARAGWVGMTAQQARRQVALSLDRQGADRAQLQELLGLRSTRQVRRLIRLPRLPLEVISREIV